MATGGVIPDGSYQLESFQQSMVGCTLVLRELGQFTRTGANTYLAQAVADVTIGQQMQQARTTFTMTTSGSMLEEAFLCGTGNARQWNYSVITSPAATTLVVSNATAVFNFVRVGP
jgi:hypothetical protein